MKQKIGGDFLLGKRKEELLKYIVEDYIQTARPISSKSLCEKMNCSSATIRGEMAELEEEGILEKTHISSGRIPSEKGYRYYVDHIMIPKELNGDDMLKLQTVFHNKSLILDDVIARSMELISELTSYTSVVLGKSSSDNLISKVEVVPLEEKMDSSSGTKMLAIVITNKGHIEHKNLVLEESISSNEMRQTVDLINKLIEGTPINQVSQVLEFEIKPIIGKYVKQHEVLYNAFYNAFTDFSDKANIKMSGTSNILKQPEFDNVDKIKEIISKFEDKNIVHSIKEEGSGINIYIGSENNLDEDLTVIQTKYKKDGEEGTIALIGPKRMEYGRVIALLNFILENIES